jgi:hypothetical protein
MIKTLDRNKYGTYRHIYIYIFFFNSVFWVMTCFTLNVEVGGFSETSVQIYRSTTEFNNSEDDKLNLECRKKLKSCIEPGTLGNKSKHRFTRSYNRYPDTRR